MLITTFSGLNLDALTNTFFVGYVFADDDYDLDEEEKAEIAKQATGDSNGASNLANGEIKKLKEEIAPEEKKEAVPTQDVIEPLESIAEQADEVEKSISSTKNGKSDEL